MACAIPAIYARALDQIPACPISDLFRDSTDALLGEIARIHSADRHFYTARDRIRGADRLAGYDAVRRLRFRHARWSDYRRLCQPAVTF